MKEIVLISSNDIGLGERGQSISCPVALALREHFHPRYLHVFNFDFNMDDVKYHLPNYITNFITSFDTWGAKSVAPMAFEIDIPFFLWVKTRLRNFTLRRKP